MRSQQTRSAGSLGACSLDEAWRLIEQVELGGTDEQQCEGIERALSLLAHCKEQYPTDANVRYSIGYAWYIHPERGVEQRRKAAEAFREALDLENDHQFALMYLGHVHFDEGDYSSALAYFEKVNIQRLLKDEVFAWRAAKVVEGQAAAKIRLGHVFGLRSDIQKLADLYLNLPGIEYREEVPLVTELVQGVEYLVRNRRMPTRSTREILAIVEDLVARLAQDDVFHDRLVALRESVKAPHG